MRKTLEDLYHGNIIPCEQLMTTNSDLLRSSSKITRCEKELEKRLGEADQALLMDLVSAQQDIDSITACENFILGFRLGVRMMADGRKPARLAQCTSLGPKEL